MNSNYRIKRSIEGFIFDEDLTARHMIFLAGPRQVGKTTFAKYWLEEKACTPLYYNWNDIATRQAYLANSRFFESAARSLGICDPWIVFDEIHKRNHWRDILKGVYDIYKEDFRFLIAGSARLDPFRPAGDSLVGRYNLFRMMPLNIGEIVNRTPEISFFAEVAEKGEKESFFESMAQAVRPDILEVYEILLRFGPFPEPFLRQNERFSRKWHQDYMRLLIREDLRDISRVAELDKIEYLISLLSPRVMAPLSMPSLARELEVAHTTVKNWLEQLRRLYVIFHISPWYKKVSRGIKKEKKWYFFDWNYAPEGSARLENMVAFYLYRACLSMMDMGYGNYRLHYMKTLDKQEIDFILTYENRPFLAVEVKEGDVSLSRTLKNRQKWLVDTDTIGLQVVNKRGVFEKHPDNTWIISVERLLSLLP